MKLASEIFRIRVGVRYITFEIAVQMFLTWDRTDVVSKERDPGGIEGFAFAPIGVNSMRRVMTLVIKFDNNQRNKVSAAHDKVGDQAADAIEHGLPALASLHDQHL